MSYLKTVGLAALVALAAMMIAGAGSASADTACLSDPAGDKCPEADQYTGAIEGLAKVAKLTAGSFTMECHSEFLANWISNEGSHVGVLYLIHKLTFTNCTESSSCKKVNEGKAENVPFWALADAVEGHVLIWNEDPITLHPAALLEECPFGVSCLYETTAEKPLLKYELLNTTEGGEFVATNLPLVESPHEGAKKILCPNEGTWNALYKITEDKETEPKSLAPLWLKALP